MAGVALGDFDSDGWLDVAAASGLSVESTPGPSGPVVPQRVLMWRAEPTVDSTSLAEVPEE